MLPGHHSLPTGTAAPRPAPTVAGGLRMAASMDVNEAAGRIKQPLSFRVADAVVGGLFAIDPLFNTISKKARNSIKVCVLCRGVCVYLCVYMCMDGVGGYWLGSEL